MKFLIIPVFLFFAACSEKTEQKTVLAAASFNVEAEKAAILKTIDNETNSFYKRDYESWQKNFLHDDYAFQGWSNADGTFDASVGWPAVDKRIGGHIKVNPANEGGVHYTLAKEKNMLVKFFTEDVAYLVWDQYSRDERDGTLAHSKEQRIMQKQNGKWKIANVSAFWDYKNKIATESLK